MGGVTGGEARGRPGRGRCQQHAWMRRREAYGRHRFLVPKLPILEGEQGLLCTEKVSSLTAASTVNTCKQNPCLIPLQQTWAPHSRIFLHGFCCFSPPWKTNIHSQSLSFSLLNSGRKARTGGDAVNCGAVSPTSQG